MRAKTISATIITMVFLVSAPGAEAQVTMGSSRPSLEAARGVEICLAVKRSLGEDLEVRTVVRTAIELGHPACTVVRCAFEGGGELKEVIAGAREAGAAPEVVSRCSIEAGADATAVAAVLTMPEIGLKLCYFEPEGAEFLRLPTELGELPQPDPIPPVQRRGFISPFTFP